MGWTIIQAQQPLPALIPNEAQTGIGVGGAALVEDMCSLAEVYLLTAKYDVVWRCSGVERLQEESTKGLPRNLWELVFEGRI